MKLERKIFWLAAAAIVLGIVGLGDRLFFGHAHAGYGSYVVWGLGVAMYLFFAGLAAGAFVVASLDLLFKMEEQGALSEDQLVEGLRAPLFFQGG